MIFGRREPFRAVEAGQGMKFRNISRLEHFTRGLWLRYHWLNRNGWLIVGALVAIASTAFRLLDLALVEAIAAGIGSVYVALMVWDRVSNRLGASRRVGPPPWDPGDPSGDREPRNAGPLAPAGAMAAPIPFDD